MDERLIEFGWKALKWAEQWLGVHYTVLFFIAGVIAYHEGLPPNLFYYTFVPIYIISAVHWMTTRKPRFWRDEHGVWRFTYNQIHGKRAVLNPIQRAKDIVANGIRPDFTLVKGNKVKVRLNGKQFTRTAETFGMADPNGNPTYSWTLTKRFALNNGTRDFKKDVNWAIESERSKVRKQLERLRKDISTNLEIPDFEIGVDYTFHNGVFEWRTVSWHDTSVPQWEKDQVAEADTLLRTKTANAHIKASLANPDIPDIPDIADMEVYEDHGQPSRNDG